MITLEVLKICTFLLKIYLAKFCDRHTEPNSMNKHGLLLFLLDHIILVSGDGDFVPVVKAIEHSNIDVTVIETLSMLSRDLEQICDRVIYWEDIEYAYVD